MTKLGANPVERQSVDLVRENVARLKELFPEVVSEAKVHFEKLKATLGEIVDDKLFSVGHEYMVVYARNKRFLKENNVILRAPKEGLDELRTMYEELRQKHGKNYRAIAGELRAWFSGLDKEDPRKPLARFKKVAARGPYRDDGNINWPGGGGSSYEVPHPATGKPCKKPRSGWRFPTKARMNEEIAKGNVVFGPDETTVPSLKWYLFEKTQQVMGTVHYSYAQTASNEFDAIFDGVRVFDNPKHYADLSQMVEYLTDDGDLVCDFFAGSCSLAHAVLHSNRRCESSRHYLCVQLPEPVDDSQSTGQNALKLGLRTIAGIGKERIRRVAASMSKDMEGHYVAFADDLERLKRDVFGPRPDKPVILHRSAIINRKGPFGLLCEEQVRTRFDAQLLEVVRHATFKMIVVIIDKKEHRDRYSSPFHPYHYCLGGMLDRYSGWLNYKNAVGDVMAESRGKEEDLQLKQAYRRVYESGTLMFKREHHQKALTSKDIKVQPKAANIAGLQLADILAHPVKQACLVEAG